MFQEPKTRIDKQTCSLNLLDGVKSKSESTYERRTNGLDVSISNTKRGRSKANLGDEIADLVRVQGHEFVDLVHRRFRAIRVEAWHALHRTAKQ